MKGREIFPSGGTCLCPASFPGKKWKELMRSAERLQKPAWNRGRKTGQKMRLVRGTEQEPGLWGAGQAETQRVLGGSGLVVACDVPGRAGSSGGYGACTNLGAWRGQPECGTSVGLSAGPFPRAGAQVGRGDARRLW